MGVSQSPEPAGDSSSKKPGPSFEDLLELSGTKGWRNVVIFCICASACFIGPLHTLTYQFLGGTPPHWCQVDDLNTRNLTIQKIKDISIPFKEKNGIKKFSECQMYNIDYQDLEDTDTYDDIYRKTEKFRKEGNVVECTSRFFNFTDETIVTKWDLVCERRVIYSTTQAAVQFGKMVGAITYGYCVDRFGRSIMFKVGVVVYILSGFLTSFSVSIYMFIILKVVSSAVGSGFYIAGFITVMEISTLSQRTVLGNYFVIPWAFGMMASMGICYLVRPWRTLQAALTAPAILLLTSFWVLPESPRWLVLNGRYNEAYDVLDGIAKSNKKTLPPVKEVTKIMERIHKMNTTEEDSSKKSFVQKFNKVLGTIFSLLIDSQMRILTLPLFFCWFSVAMVYYGVSLTSTALSTDPYLYIFLGGVIELFSCLTLWPVAALMGRKNGIIMYFFVCAFSILSAMVMVFYVEKDEYTGLKTTLFLSGKFAITAAFHLIYVFTAELYPTKVRSLAIGESSSVARIGSMSSPYINDILGASTLWAPAAMFGAVSVAAGFITCLLPDTSGINLPDSLEKKKGKQNSVTNPAYEAEETDTQI